MYFEVVPFEQQISEMTHLPRASLLVNGEVVIFRFLEKEDEAALRSFAESLPEEELEKLRDDFHDPLTVSNLLQFLDHGELVPVVALEQSGNRIIGLAVLQKFKGVHRHVADIRVVVSGSHRKLGLGSAMIKELNVLGAKMGLFYLRAEILAENRLGLKAFRQLGFQTACTIDGYFLSKKGRVYDVIHMYKQLRATMEEDFFYEF